MHGHLEFPQGRFSSGLGAGDDTFCALLSLGLFLVMAGGMVKEIRTSTHPLSFLHAVCIPCPLPPHFPSLAGCLPHTSALFPCEVSHWWSHGDTGRRGQRWQGRCHARKCQLCNHQLNPPRMLL